LAAVVVVGSRPSVVVEAANAASAGIVLVVVKDVEATVRLVSGGAFASGLPRQPRQRANAAMMQTMRMIDTFTYWLIK